MFKLVTHSNYKYNLQFLNQLYSQVTKDKVYIRKQERNKKSKKVKKLQREKTLIYSKKNIKEFESKRKRIIKV